VLEQQRQALEQRLTDLEQLAQQQARQDALTSDVTQFCENITSVLQSPTPEEKQQVLRLVVDHILVGKEQLTIKHIIPLIGDSRLCTQRYNVTFRSGQVSLRGAERRSNLSQARLRLLRSLRSLAMTECDIVYLLS
jgi:hypothetical protein